MKTSRIILTVAAAALALVSCKQLSEEEIQQRKDAIDETIGSYEEQINVKADSLMSLTDLTEDQMREQLYAYYDTLCTKISKDLVKSIKANRRNDAGLYAYTMLTMYEEDPQTLSNAYKLLSKDVKAGYEAFKDFTVHAYQVTDDGSTEETEVSLSDYVGKGKYMLVDFWASWCNPCKGEIPNIKAVYEKYAGEDFDVLSVAVWDKADDTFMAADEHGIVWNQIVPAPEDNRIPTDTYGIKGIPQIILFGPDGKIVARDLRGEGIEAAVSQYVSAKN